MQSIRLNVSALSLNHKPKVFNLHISNKKLTKLLIIYP